ncbi:MAG: type II toxin-antitoxin system RelE/ParE family toxin [Armatimonadetes bacterium]|nr:type II toxin-antitoxin system RelE/ParE family toxin [Armatimonadota bacterium]
MSYTLVFRGKARKQFLALPAEVRQRLETALRTAAQNPYAPGVKKLRGRLKDYRRVRAGEHRALILLDNRSRTIEVVEVGPRGAVY